MKAHHWTRVEYERFVELGVFEGWKIELVRGILFDMPLKSAQHAGSVSKLLRELREVSSGKGLSVRPQAPLAVSEDSLPDPDIAVVPDDPEGDFYSAAHPTTAALVIEVADLTLQFDREVKEEIYARAGIPEYWIVNLVARHLEIYRQPSGDRYSSLATLSLSDEISPLFAPEASIQVARLLPKEPQGGGSV